MSEPIKCPLCGEIPVLIDLAGWEIWCKCGIQLVLDNGSDKEALIIAWNTRVNDNKGEGE